MILTGLHLKSITRYSARFGNKWLRKIWRWEQKDREEQQRQQNEG